jgi:hypothetical protein
VFHSRSNAGGHHCPYAIIAAAGIFPKMAKLDAQTSLKSGGTRQRVWISLLQRVKRAGLHFAVILYLAKSNISAVHVL